MPSFFCWRADKCWSIPECWDIIERWTVRFSPLSTRVLIGPELTVAMSLSEVPWVGETSRLRLLVVQFWMQGWGSGVLTWQWSYNAKQLHPLFLLQILIFEFLKSTELSFWHKNVCIRRYVNHFTYLFDLYGLSLILCHGKKRKTIYTIYNAI